MPYVNKNELVNMKGRLGIFSDGLFIKNEGYM
jgi:hypothetical protein